MARGGSLTDPATPATDPAAVVPRSGWFAALADRAAVAGRSVWFAGLSLAVAAVIYGPMLRPGYPLRFDLVSVPHPVLGEDALGLGDRLPRAIPLDAATAVLARVIPGSVLTQLLGLLALTLAGWGAAVLTPAPLPGRLFALLVAEWNPFVLEQLAIGHLPHLFAYGALPWVAVAGQALARGSGGRSGDRSGGVRAWAGLTVAAGFGSLTPGGGVLCAIAAVAGLAAGAFGRAPGRQQGAGWRVVAGLASVVVLQLPWLVAGLAAPAFSDRTATTDAGLTAFALRSETGWGRLVDAAGLAGMWNQSALPASRNTVLARVSTVLLLALAAAGLPAIRRFWRAGFRAELLAGAGAGAIGYLIAVLPVLPGGRWLLERLTGVVPGAALLRDGHRWLALPAVLIAVLCGLGVSELATRASPAQTSPGASPQPIVGPQPELAAGPKPVVGQPVSGLQPAAGLQAQLGPKLRAIGVVLFAALLLIASMPDLAGGLDGRLRARHYPAQWAQLRTVLDASPDRARVLVLPWQPFRVFAWAGPDPVLDPAPRLLPRQSIVSDALTVSGHRLPEEGLGARAIAVDLTDGRLSADTLGSLSIGWVLVEHGTPGRLPALPPGWTAAIDGPQLTLLRAPGELPSAPHPSTARAIGVIGSQLVAGLLLLAALVALTVTGLGSGRSRRSPSFRSG